MGDFDEGSITMIRNDTPYDLGFQKPVLLQSGTPQRRSSSILIAFHYVIIALDEGKSSHSSSVLLLYVPALAVLPKEIVAKT